MCVGVKNGCWDYTPFSISNHFSDIAKACFSCNEDSLKGGFGEKKKRKERKTRKEVYMESVMMVFLFFKLD